MDCISHKIAVDGFMVILVHSVIGALHVKYWRANGVGVMAISTRQGNSVAVSGAHRRPSSIIGYFLGLWARCF